MLSKCRQFLSVIARRIFRVQPDSWDGIPGGDFLRKHYRYVGRVGSGGQSEAVVRATERAAPYREVAIKLGRLSRNAEEQRAQLERSSREWQTLRACPAPNLPKFYWRAEFQDKHGDLFVALVMEFIEGPTLEALLSQASGAAPYLVGTILPSVAGALDLLHSHGIIHRDIKPANIIFTPRGLACLVDFGIVRPSTGCHTVTKVNQCVGTPAYMSPEAVRGSSRLTPASDIYSLTVIACCAITGRKPFDADTLFSLMLKICNEEPDLSGVPPLVKAVLRRGLAKKPEDRHQRAADFVNDLTAALYTVGIPMRPSGDHGDQASASNVAPTLEPSAANSTASFVAAIAVTFFVTATVAAGLFFLARIAD